MNQALYANMNNKRKRKKKKKKKKVFEKKRKRQTGMTSAKECQRLKAAHCKLGRSTEGLWSQS
jgi:hypothetical protein